jgi:hypothetical protein
VSVPDCCLELFFYPLLPTTATATDATTYAVTAIIPPSSLHVTSSTPFTDNKISKIGKKSHSEEAFLLELM